MGALVGKPKVPKVEPVAPPPTAVEREVEVELTAARDKSKKAALAANGARSTMHTGPLGVVAAVPQLNIGRKTLLGQ